MNTQHAQAASADERERMERFGHIKPPAEVTRTNTDDWRALRAEFFAEHPELAPPCERTNPNTSKGAA